MGCGVSKIDNREDQEMEDDSMYVYYNLLPHRPEADDRPVDCRQKAVEFHKEAGLLVGPDHKGDDKDNNVVNGVPGPNTISSLSSTDDSRPTKADEVVVGEFESSAGIIVEENGIDHNNDQQRHEIRDQLGLSEEENTLHPRSPSLLGNRHFPGVHGSTSGDYCADGDIIRMKKLDIMIDGEKEDNVDTCTEIILSPHHPLREFACKNLRNKQLPRSLSLKKSRRKWRRFRMPGPRSCSGSVKNLLIDATDSRYPSPTRRSCSHSSDIHVKYYSLQV